MARRVGLPRPSTSPFGGGGGAFGAYDVLDSGRGDNIEWQKAQAAWAAGRISNGAYLAAWQGYINKLDVGSSTYINAVQGLRQQRYVFARDDIVTRIEDTDPKSQAHENAWADLLEYDARNVDGMVPSNEERRQRQDRLRSTQNGMFQLGYNSVSERYAKGRMTTAQVRQWYQSQLQSSLVHGNPALRRQIVDSMGELRERERTEARDEVYKTWSEDGMPPEEFLTYAMTQIALLPDGSDEEEKWRGYVQQARIEVRQASMDYRWSLSQRYRELQSYMVDPSTKGGTGATRTIFRDGQWVEVPVSEAPSEGDRSSYQQRQADKALWKAEMDRIEQRMAATGDGFIDPTDMIAFYSKQLNKYAPGTDSHFAVQAQIDRYEDMAALWKAQDASVAGGMFVTPEPAPPPELPGGPEQLPGGKMLPGEEGMTLDRFMRSVASVESGGNYRSVNSESGARGKYQIMPANWSSWARTYLGDSNAKWTPENQEKVARGKMVDLHKWLGSWARVAYWWLTGDGRTTDTGQWSSQANYYVNEVMSRSGIGRLPKNWDFEYSIDKVPRTPRVPPPPGAYTGPPRSGWGGRTDLGGGANLTDASAGAAGYGVSLVDRNSSWSDLVRALKNGKGAITQGYAMVFEGTGQGSERYDPNYVKKGLDTNHAVFIWGWRERNGKAQILWLDPLAEDGHEGHWVDAHLVRSFLTTYSGGTGRVGVAISPRAIRVPPTVVTEREPGPWTGCTWGSTAMMINGLRGRRVATMANVRAYGESGLYQPSDVFGAYRNSASRNLTDDPRAPRRASSPTDDKSGVSVRSVEAGQPVVPGPQAAERTTSEDVGVQPTQTGWTWPQAEQPGRQTEQGPSPVVLQTGVPPAKARTPDFYTLETANGPRGVTPVPGHFKKGLTPGAFDNFYQAYRNAFLTGLSTFMFTDPNGRTRNYYVGSGDPLARRTMMESLDTQRIELTAHLWKKAANDPNANPDTVAERSRAYDDAVHDAAQNAFDTLFMGQTGDVDPEGSANANPAADVKRLSTSLQTAVQEHYDLALRRWEAGDETGAMAEIQSATDLIDRHKETLDGYVAQVQGTVEAWGREGQQPDRETAEDIQTVVDWSTEIGLTADTKGNLAHEDSEKLLKDITSVIRIGPDGRPVVNPADGQLVLADGVYRIINQSSDPSRDDTITYERAEMTLEHDASGELVYGYGEPDHVNTKVFVNGRWVAAQAKWKPTVVGQIIDAAGNRHDLYGKQISARLNGQGFVQFEQPLAPGRWSTSPVYYKAPDTFEVTYDESSGAPSYSWVGADATGAQVRFTIGFDQGTASYNLYQQGKTGMLGDQWSEPVGVGPLAGNPLLQDGLDWQRDLTGLDAAGRFGADLEGGTLGLSASSLAADWAVNQSRKGRMLRFNAEQARRAREAASEATASVITGTWGTTRSAPTPRPAVDPSFILPGVGAGFDASLARWARERSTPTPSPTPSPTPTAGPQRSGDTPFSSLPTPTPTRPNAPSSGTRQRARNAASDDLLTSGRPRPPAPVPTPTPRPRNDEKVPLPRVPPGGGGPIKS